MEGDKINGSRLVIAHMVRNICTQNFYRFCECIERLHPDLPALGTTDTPSNEPIRFCHWLGLGFPSSELRMLEQNPVKKVDTLKVYTTFLGLIGVDGILPYTFVTNIVCDPVGTQAFTALLDIFHHRLLTFYYRIWRKCRYPVSFSHASDPLSRCLFFLARPVVLKTPNELPPVHQYWLALLGFLGQRGRTVDGVSAIVRYLLPKMLVDVQQWYPTLVTMPSARLVGRSSMLSVAEQIAQQHIRGLSKPSLGEQARLFEGDACGLVPDLLDKYAVLGSGETVLGKFRTESQQAIRIILILVDDQIPEVLLPECPALLMLRELMRGYIGSRWDIFWFLRLPTTLVPVCMLGSSCVRLGLTSYLPLVNQERCIELPLGRDCARANIY